MLPKSHFQLQRVHTDRPGFRDLKDICQGQGDGASHSLTPVRVGCSVQGTLWDETICGSHRLLAIFVSATRSEYGRLESTTSLQGFWPYAWDRQSNYTAASQLSEGINSGGNRKACWS